MKLVKTVLAWEHGLPRVTPFGTLTFNHNGVCAIDNDELAQMVIDSSSSLMESDATPEEQAELLATLKAEDAAKHIPVDEKALGEFMANSAYGVEAVAESAKTIGVPATEALEAGKEDNGNFTPLVDLTETPAKEDELVKSTDETKEDGMSTEAFADSLKGYKHSELKELLIEGGVDLSKYSSEETKSKAGLIKIACDVKAKA